MNTISQILVVVPARGGSKGIKLKNLALVGGETLIALVEKVVSKLPKNFKTIVSTDHHAIVKEARRVGLDVPFFRPSNLSGGRVSDVDVLTHALMETEKSYTSMFDMIVMLQPTCPLRRTTHVTSVVDKLMNEGYDSVLTVSQTDSKSHPLKQLMIVKDIVKYYDARGKEVIVRQQLSDLYHRNGSAYAMTRHCLVEQKSVIGERAGCIVINEPLVNIDSPWDLELANWLYEKNMTGLNDLLVSS